ncbi:MAG: T9SS type A sorting domain-containing protein [Bacteroidota bacterium]
MKTHNSKLRLLPRNITFLLFFFVVTLPLQGQVSIAFTLGATQNLDPGDNINADGQIINLGATQAFNITATQLGSDDVDLNGLAMAFNGVSIGSSGTIFLGNMQFNDLDLFGVMPADARPCDEAKVLIEVFTTGGQLVEDITFTARAIIGPTNAAELIIRDDGSDIGAEPYIASPEFASPDLWVRRQNDGQTTHQNPDFVSIQGNANKVFTRVRNVGCLSSKSADLHLYWTRARTHETWDDHWLHFSNPSAPNNFIIWPSNSNTKRPLGGEITIADPNDPASSPSPVTIPPLSRGQVHTIQPVDWFPPNPIWYQNDGDPIVPVGNAVHPALCLLARLVSTDDPMNNEGNPRDVVFNVRDNNNIAARNTYLTNDVAFFIPGDQFGNYSYGFASYAVNNPTGVTTVIDLELAGASAATENSFLDYGNVNIALSNNLWASWEAGGFQSSGVTIVGPGLVRMTDPSTARLVGITLPPGADYSIAFQYEFFGSVSVTEDILYDFQFAQYPSGSATYMGSPNHMLTIVERNVLKSEQDPRSPSLLVDMDAYPNPAGDVISVSFTLREAAPINLVLRDLQGREVTRLIHGQRYEAGLHSLSVDLSELGSGVYLLQFAAPGTLVTEKVVHTTR